MIRRKTKTGRHWKLWKWHKIQFKHDGSSVKFLLCSQPSSSNSLSPTSLKMWRDFLSSCCAFSSKLCPMPHERSQLTPQPEFSSCLSLQLLTRKKDSHESFRAIPAIYMSPLLHLFLSYSGMPPSCCWHSRLSKELLHVGYHISRDISSALWQPPDKSTASFRHQESISPSGSIRMKVV